jgi:hypothetical protein
MERNELHVPNGTPLSVACRIATELALDEGCIVYFSFNDIEVEVLPGENKEEAFEQYHSKKGQN